MTQPESEYPLLLTASENHVGQRVDHFLAARFPELSRTIIQKWISAGSVLSKNRPIKKNLRLDTGTELTILAGPPLPPSTLKAENIPLNIVYEDEDIVVIHKPRNLVVHPGNGIHGGTLAAGLLYHYQTLSTLGGDDRPGIVHRLDRDTPGLMVCARNDLAHRKLSAQLEDRSMHRTYNAVVWGQISDESGEVDAPVGRNRRDRTKMCVRGDGRQARTRFKVLEYFDWASLLELQLDTGRTHQIRVHMSHVGHPVLGDPLYQGREKFLEKLGPMDRSNGNKILTLCSAQLLQAVKLAFIHPADGRKMEFEIPREKDFEEVVETLRKMRKFVS